MGIGIGPSGERDRCRTWRGGPTAGRSVAVELSAWRRGYWSPGLGGPTRTKSRFGATTPNWVGAGTGIGGPIKPIGGPIKPIGGPIKPIGGPSWPGARKGPGPGPGPLPWTVPGNGPGPGTGPLPLPCTGPGTPPSDAWPNGTPTKPGKGAWGLGPGKGAWRGCPRPSILPAGGCPVMPALVRGMGPRLAAGPRPSCRGLEWLWPWLWLWLW